MPLAVPSMVTSTRMPLFPEDTEEPLDNVPAVFSERTADPALPEIPLVVYAAVAFMLGLKPIGSVYPLSNTLMEVVFSRSM